MYFQSGCQLFLCILGVIQLVSPSRADNLLFNRIAAPDLEMCSRDTGVTVNGFEEVREKQGLGHSELCFLKCVLEKVGFLKDGKLVVEAAKDLFQNEINEKREECLRRIGPLSTCDDLQQIETCRHNS
uniref:Odorant binding protein 12 n=1 Tax=Tomicus yunnanensis TaxID=768153 RepID=A0A4P2HJ07_9CUCU|nr:odorant binding protein 12 [Tomicus yunnanensis]